MFEAINSLVSRYGLMTDRALAALRPDLFTSIAQAGRSLRACAAAGRLVEETLYGNRRCFRLANPELAPFSEPAKAHAYAMLRLCSIESRSRTHLTREEFQQYFPKAYRPGLPMNYYVDLSSDNPRLGFLRFDRGGKGRWDRVLAKAKGDVRYHHLEPAFFQFQNRNAIEVRIVTALSQKADRIRRALEDESASTAIPIAVTVIPELVNLLAPLPS